MAELSPEQRAREQIDTQLSACGWVVQNYKQYNPSVGRGIALREVPLKSGSCDYLLLVDRNAVGVIEAKKQGTLLSGVAEQSAHYAVNLPDMIQSNSVGSLPFLYETTSIETFFRDERDPEPRSRPVFTFHRPETLAEWILSGDTLRARLADMPSAFPLPTQNLRDCQIEGITNLEQSFVDARPRDKVLAGFRTQKIEAYSCDAFNLVERFTSRKDIEPVAGGEGCLPDASLAPLDDFRYRFGPLQEREQKRQYATSQDQALAGLMWTYTLLGADAKQLASYNGIQGGFCGQPANTLWMWPVEYNSYGPAQSRIITRPQGAKEFPIGDHLGSTRLTLNQAGDILQRLDYEPFGSEINEAGDGARTSYIGREKDNESELGFYGVRMYEPEYGRFMSVDPLWGKYAPMQPYQYSLNSPLGYRDGGGAVVEAADKAAQIAITNSLPESQRSCVEFDDNGQVKSELLSQLVSEVGPNSNAGGLLALVSDPHVTRVHVQSDFKYQNAVGGEQNGSLMEQGKATPIGGDPGKNYVGITLVPRSEESVNASRGQKVFFSTDNKTNIFISPSVGRLTNGISSRGSTAAHELVGHALPFLKFLRGLSNGGWWHSAPKVDGSCKNAEAESKKK